MARSNKEVRIATPTARAKWSQENRGEQETGDSSFRVPYYGATGASVPFMWESQPGTPKHHIFSKNDHFAPPLTPPPSYTCSFSPSPSPSSIKTRKAGFFSAFLSSFSRKTNRHVNATSSSTSDSGPLSWTTASSSSSPVSSPPRHSTQSPLFEGRHKVGSRNKQIMCFGYNKQGCYSMLNVKNSIVSIKAH